MRFEDILLTRQEIPVYTFPNEDGGGLHGVVIPIHHKIIKYFDKKKIPTQHLAKNVLNELMKQPNLEEAVKYEFERRINIETKIYETFKKFNKPDIKQIFSEVLNINSAKEAEGNYGNVNFVRYMFGGFITEISEAKRENNKNTIDEVHQRKIKELKTSLKYYIDLSHKRSKEYLELPYLPNIVNSEHGLCHLCIWVQGTALCIESEDNLSFLLNMSEEKLREYFPTYFDRFAFEPHNIDNIFEAIVGREWGINYINVLLTELYNKNIL